MESINALKGYGKVSDQENQTQNPKPSSRKALFTAIAIASISTFFIIIIIGLTTVAIAHQPNQSQKSLKTICSMTQHPNLCLTTLSDGSNQIPPDPESIFLLSLQVSFGELSNLTYSFKSINDLPEEAAVKDCLSLLEDATSRFNDSILAMDVKGGDGEKKVVLDEGKIGDIRTWISGSMTDVETCKDGLEEMGTVVGCKVKEGMERVEKVMSNSLAIVSQMKVILEKFHATMH